jgi:pyruvate dehydrogenase E2 component (dihydrolipoamide acetyltransferase)
MRTADGAIATYTAMGLSPACDHRAADGAPASKFLRGHASARAGFNALLAKEEGERT